MKYTFVKNKDGHKVGETIELSPNDWFVFYWTKKRVITPVRQEVETTVQEPEIETQEAPVKKTRKKK